MKDEILTDIEIPELMQQLGIAIKEKMEEKS